jgi:hypothetical protein
MLRSTSAEWSGRGARVVGQPEQQAFDLLMLDVKFLYGGLAVFVGCPDRQSVLAKVQWDGYELELAGADVKQAGAVILVEQYANG